MNNQDKKIIDRLENEFYQIASNAISQQESIEREDIENMKDLQKICYYMEVRCAMKEAEDEYMDDPDYEERSYRGRSYNSYNGGNMYGRGNMNSYARGGYNRTSGRRGSSYMNNGRSGRRYYDNEAEKENSVNDLRQMLQMEKDPEKIAMLEGIMHVLENDK